VDEDIDTLVDKLLERKNNVETPKKKKKHILEILMLLAGLFAVINIIVYSDSGDTTVQVEDYVVMGGETFNVTVDLYPTIPIKAFEFRIGFNASLVQAIEVTEGDIFEGFETFFSSGIIDNTNGTIEAIYNLILGTGNTSNNGTMVDIAFISQNVEGQSSVRLYGCGVTNETEYIPINIVNGSITVDLTPPDVTTMYLNNSAVLDTLIGWNNVSGIVFENFNLSTCQLNILEPDGSWNNVSFMDQYYNTTFSGGDYSYHVYVEDEAGHTNFSDIYQFSMPENWDVKVDGVINVLDLVYVAQKYNILGPFNGWIREDVDNNGEVKILDLVLVSQYYE
jgi:hypothetical protein